MLIKSTMLCLFYCILLFNIKALFVLLRNLYFTDILIALYLKPLCNNYDYISMCKCLCSNKLINNTELFKPNHLVVVIPNKYYCLNRPPLSSFKILASRCLVVETAFCRPRFEGFDWPTATQRKYEYSNYRHTVDHYIDTQTYQRKYEYGNYRHSWPIHWHTDLWCRNSCVLFMMTIIIILMIIIITGFFVIDTKFFHHKRILKTNYQWMLLFCK